MSSPPVDASTPAPHLRADAARNRQKILDVAARLFAERGIEVTLNDIAHEAGVGVGTVYRKFADKDALIEELTDHKLQRMLDLVASASDLEPSTALRTIMMDAAALRAQDRGLFPMLFQRGDAERRDDRVRRLLDGWDHVISRARAVGAVRAGFSPVDIDLFMLMVGVVADATRDLEPTAWRRAAQVLIDGYAVAPQADVVPVLDVDASTRRAIFLRY